MFAVLLPDLQRYIGRVAANVAKRSAADRQDLVQVGLMAVWVECQSGKIGRHASSLGLSLRVAKLAVLNAARVADRRAFAGLDAATADRLTVEDEAPDEFAVLVALVENPVDRRILRERFAGGRTFADIGNEIGVTRGAVQQRAGRALAQLRERVG